MSRLYNMGERDKYKAEVSRCFSHPGTVQQSRFFNFFIGDTKNMAFWKQVSVRKCDHVIDQYNLYWESHTGDHYTKKELELFSEALPNCIPLFGHLYSETYKTDQQCFCPCCPSLKGWRDNNQLSFINPNDLCEDRGFKTRHSIIGHFNFFTDQKNILHELSLVFINSYSEYFQYHNGNPPAFKKEIYKEPISLNCINPATQFPNTDRAGYPPRNVDSNHASDASYESRSVSFSSHGSEKSSDKDDHPSVASPRKVRIKDSIEKRYYSYRSSKDRLGLKYYYNKT